MPKVLLIEDDVSFCKMLESFLTRKDFDVDAAFSATEGKAKLKAKLYDLIITDLRLPDDDGLSLVTQFKSLYPEIPVILMTGYSDIGTAVKAMKNGAADYISKPFNPEEVLLVVNNALSSGIETKPEKKSSKPSKETFVSGSSRESKKLSDYIQLVAPTDMSVLIIGESGTGKEIIARQIYENSNRKDKNFVAVDCGTIPKELAASEFFGHVRGSFTGAVSDKVGHFENADGGTLFLDEIGNLSYENQILLLRALQERRIKPVGSNAEIAIDIRLITATNENLREKVASGDFREDLYHRINEFSIHSAPLRERSEDLMIFAEYFLDKSNEQLHKNIIGFSPEVIAVFKQYHWPGNLRELQNIIKRSVLLTTGEFVQQEVLPKEIFETENRNNPNMSLSDREKLAIISALERTNNNKSEAAKLLEINRKTLYNKLKLYGLE